MASKIVKTEEIIHEIRSGRMVILVDEEDRENEGDLLMASEFVTPDTINFMARNGRGLICLTLTQEHCTKLGLPPMVRTNGSRLGTNFTVSIEAAKGVTTGISAADRAHTILTAVNKTAEALDIVQPGHIFPLRAEEGGVLVRAGHTEAGCDLTRLAGLTPSAVICEILKDNGEMARLPDLEAFAKKHFLKIGTITDLINYRSRTEKIVERVFKRAIRTGSGEFLLIGYKDKITQEAHFALCLGDIENADEVLVRVHEPLSIADLLEVDNQNHSWSLKEALNFISAEGLGVLILLHRTETGEQLLNRFSEERRSHADRVPLRTYGIGAQILKDLNIRRMKLLSNPRRMPSMAGFDLEVTGYVPKKSN
ncbi:MAG: 3,4-dihydroxy-2-butanone-4-phosphate synthase [Proteobacteria bacterium]|nr:3,4-dihydroxy-2-butanone-4-phosphate synthase [Pseudomonadota bacterium]